MIYTEKFTELEVIQRILDGEIALFEIIVRRFNPYLYKIGRSYNFNHEDTQDLMQDTFIDAYKNLERFEGRSEFKTWIIRIMMNNCYRKKEKSAFRNEIILEVNDNSRPMFTDAGSDTDKIIQNRELTRVLEEAMVAIPFDYRIVFSLREINGMNVAETAELLHISESNVKVRLSRAKAMLRNEMEKTYAASTIFEFNLVHCDKIVSNV